MRETDEYELRAASMCCRMRCSAVDGRYRPAHARRDFRHKYQAQSTISSARSAFAYVKRQHTPRGAHAFAPTRANSGILHKFNNSERSRSSAPSPKRACTISLLSCAPGFPGKIPCASMLPWLPGPFWPVSAIFGAKQRLHPGNDDVQAEKSWAGPMSLKRE